MLHSKEENLISVALRVVSRFILCLMVLLVPSCPTSVDKKVLDGYIIIVADIFNTKDKQSVFRTHLAMMDRQFMLDILASYSSLSLAGQSNQHL